MSSRLKTSFLTYRDDQINASKASRLCVYRYPLETLGKQFWDWMEQTDSQLSRSSYPYYLHSPSKNLYVALENDGLPLPKITAKDGTELIAEKVEYEPRHNPIWLRLILRMIGHELGMTKGYRALGKPMLKLAEWGGKTPGFEAIDIDTQVWQRSDKVTTEVSIKFDNVRLKKLGEDDKKNGKIWCYGKDGWLARWFPGEEEYGVLYQELKKAKGSRKNRPFLNLKSDKLLTTSRGYFLGKLVAEFQNKAAEYGFPLKQDELKLDKYASFHRPDKGKRMKSLPLLEYKVYVVDARENLDIEMEDIIAWFSRLLSGEGLEIELISFPKQPHNLNDLVLEPNSRYLVVLDQRQGLPQDPYELTSRFAKETAVQHVIINPHEIGDVEVEKWFETNSDGTVIGVAEDYFDYDFSLLESHSSAVALRLVVCAKELHFKQLMRDKSATIEQYLPFQSDLLTDITLISNGHLLSFYGSRPVIFPFKLSDPDVLAQINQHLSNHDISADALIASAFENWPYGFSPEEKYRNNPDKFLKRMTFFLKGKGTILLQNPGHISPVLTPDGIEGVLQLLKNKKAKRLPKEWLIPESAGQSSFETDLDRIFKDSVKKNERLKFQSILIQLVDKWNLLIRQLPHNKVLSQNELRPQFNKIIEDVIGGDRKMLGWWWRFLSSILNYDVYDPRVWLREIPGLKDIWYDSERGYYLVGDLNNLNVEIERQPSISRWHAMRGQANPSVLMPYLDVDFIRVGQFAGRVFPHMLIRCHEEMSS